MKICHVNYNRNKLSIAPSKKKNIRQRQRKKREINGKDVWCSTYPWALKFLPRRGGAEYFQPDAPDLVSPFLLFSDNDDDDDDSDDAIQLCLYIYIYMYICEVPLSRYCFAATLLWSAFIMGGDVGGFIGSLVNFFFLLSGKMLIL